MFLTSDGKRGLISLFLKASEACLGACMSIVLARILGADDFGVFSFGLAAITLFSIPIKTGVSTMITKEMALGEAECNYRVAANSFWISVRVTIIYSIMVISAVYALKHFGGGEIKLFSSVFMIVLSMPFLCLIGLLEGVLRGSFRPFSSIVVGTVLIPALLLIYALFLNRNIASPGPIRVSCVYVLASVFVFLVALLISLKHLRNLRPVGFKENGATISWIKTVSPFIIVSGLLIFNRQIDLVLLGLLESERAAGIYRISAQAAILVTFGVQAIGHLYAPYFAVSGKSCNFGQVSAYLRKSVFFALTFGLTAVLSLVIFGNEVIVMMAGYEFVTGYKPMLILCSANIAVALNGSITQALTMQGYQLKVAWVFVGAGLIAVIGHLVLIPSFGIIGAASASFIAIVLWSLALRIYACRIWSLSFILLHSKST